jgi:hypothetical protein
VILPLVTYGDVEQELAEYLRGALPGITVGTRIPASPDVFVLIRRAGGTRARYVDSPRIDVQVWHRSDTEAHDLADLVSGLLWRAQGVGHLRGVTGSSSPVPVPDPDSGASRYLLTVDLTAKGVPA